MFGIIYLLSVFIYYHYHDDSKYACIHAIRPDLECVFCFIDRNNVYPKMKFCTNRLLNIFALICISRELRPFVNVNFDEVNKMTHCYGCISNVIIYK